MRARAGAAGAIAAALLLTGCGGGGAAADADFTADPTGAMTGWGFENTDDVGQARLDHAASQLEGVEIELDQTAFDAQKFTTLAASGNMPDVVQIDRQFVATYAAQGLIMPLDECFAAHEVDAQQRWYPQVVQDVTWQDQVWAVPQFYQPPLILTNTRVMEEAGVSADDLDPSDPEALIAAAEAMTVSEGGSISRVGFDPQGVSKAAMWMLSFGGGIVDESGAPTLDREENVAAAEFLIELYDAQGGFAEVTGLVESFDIFGDGNPYVTDGVGAAVFDQWYVNVLTPYAEQIEIGAVPIRNQEGQPFTATGGSSFVIPASAENPSAACAWALALTDPEAWQAAAEARAETTEAEPERLGINTGLFTGSPESDMQIRDEFASAEGFPGFEEAIEAYYAVAAEGASLGGSPAGQQIQGELENAMQSALLGERSAQEALTAAQEAAQRAYDQVAGG
ncbi:extracellular solute-binding protein [Agrococcus sediminis]|uniref:Extracellular solute-binding protein n=1 Tax=Agrococcus sediminis TaxID=2599924 RepID=A0A5M8QG08_9MICO|nr:MULTISPECIES: extracellular solute-binding protein [Agrococcus]KAA6434975.1 extracellular solute-binding protein [Agrococcus sediminis]MDR7233258.1 multiple sugar transport system substrate-binding protein [Agrococcus sp. BE272]